MNDNFVKFILDHAAADTLTEANTAYENFCKAVEEGSVSRGRLIANMEDWAAAGHPVDYAAYAESLAKSLPTEEAKE